MGIGTIGVLTSGGDAPGMNACVRAVVRTALYKGIKVKAIMKGYQGLITGEIIDIDNRRFVSEIINRGGTILHTARCLSMTTPEGVLLAADAVKKAGIDCLVVCGGDGSYRGALELSKAGVNVLCIPGTIDLDIASTDYTIGFDTALNTAMDAINKLRDTSTSHDRVSVVEVMGRRAGYIALWAGIAGGADVILTPEKPEDNDIDKICDIVNKNKDIGKTHSLIVVAEGVGSVEEIAKNVQEKTGIEARATILGHLQRGGYPTALDRVHASMMGGIAVEIANEERFSRAICYKNGRYIDIDLQEAINMEKTIDKTMYDISKMLV
ncbi:MAG: 6-phosphofructokinase [Clostridia bacterium]|nr:6-phosphofructokinase [Clostridia bacterium]